VASRLLLSERSMIQDRKLQAQRLSDNAPIVTHGRLRYLPYSGITCIVAVPGTGPGIGTGAGAA
ncbi:MAG: hypothetical protein WCD39_11280, partial [Methyloceanibacter sp.]